MSTPDAVLIVPPILLAKKHVKYGFTLNSARRKGTAYAKRAFQKMCGSVGYLSYCSDKIPDENPIEAFHARKNGDLVPLLPKKTRTSSRIYGPCRVEVRQNRKRHAVLCSEPAQTHENFKQRSVYLVRARAGCAETLKTIFCFMLHVHVGTQKPQTTHVLTIHALAERTKTSTRFMIHAHTGAPKS